MPCPSANHALASPASAATRARSASSESPGAGAWTSAAMARALERNVAMLLGRIAVALAGERGERVDQARPRVARVDDVVQIAARGGLIGVREFIAVFRDLLFGRLALVENLDRALRPHHRDLRRGPGDVVVAADVL